MQQRAGERDAFLRLNESRRGTCRGVKFKMVTGMSIALETGRIEPDGRCSCANRDRDEDRVGRCTSRVQGQGQRRCVLSLHALQRCTEPHDG